MRVMLELSAPGMEHGQSADLGAEMLGITGDVLEALRHGAKEQAIEHPLIVQDQGRERPAAA